MTTLSIGTLLAAASICECSTAPGGRKVAAKLYEAARMPDRSQNRVGTVALWVT